MADLPDGYELLPYWASDGSGIFLGRQTQAGSNVLSLLLPDGTIASGDTGMIGSGYGRRYRSDGVEVNDAHLPLSGLDISDLAWTADGDGAWLAVHSSADGHQLTLERVVVPSLRQTMATIHDAVGEPAASRPEGHLVGLAPDDSMIVLSMDSITGSVDGLSGEPRPRVLVNPESGASFVIEGSFVGWLAVDR